MNTIKAGFEDLRNLLDFAPDGVVAAAILAIAVVLALVIHRVATAILDRTLRGRHPLVAAVLDKTHKLTRIALILLIVRVALPAAPLTPDAAQVLGRLLVLAFVGMLGWTVITVLHLAADLYLRKFRIDVADNLLARKHVTQVRILLRVIDTLIVVVTTAAALMTFESVREYGVSLFASAGVAGLVVGLAARPVLSNLLAGIQIAVTQPIRIDDAVIVEGEWGVIEEITSTYVVVRIWDLRRLIVPILYFIEKPFQNWTREGSELIGSAMLYLDHAAPMAAIRAKANDIVAQSSRWDGKVFAVQVTDVKEWVIEVRVIAGARSAGAAFDLRCEIREKLLGFLNSEHPEALPRRRQQATAVDPSPPPGMALDSATPVREKA